MLYRPGDESYLLLLVDTSKRENSRLLWHRCNSRGSHAPYTLSDEVVPPLPLTAKFTIAISKPCICMTYRPAQAVLLLWSSTKHIKPASHVVVVKARGCCFLSLVTLNVLLNASFAWASPVKWQTGLPLLFGDALGKHFFFHWTSQKARTTFSAVSNKHFYRDLIACYSYYVPTLPEPRKTLFGVISWRTPSKAADILWKKASSLEGYCGTFFAMQGQPLKPEQKLITPLLSKKQARLWSLTETIQKAQCTYIGGST